MNTMHSTCCVIFSSCRGSTINMSAFGYVEELKQDIENETLSDVRVMTGVSRYLGSFVLLYSLFIIIYYRAKSRCRKTDFFGFNAGERSISPNAFTYSPPAVTTSILKHHRCGDELSSMASSGAQSMSRLGVATRGSTRGFNNSRASTNSFNNTVPSKVEISPFDNDDDISQISGLTINTRGSHSRHPRFMHVANKHSLMDKKYGVRNDKPKGRSGRSPFFPNINSRGNIAHESYPKNRTLSTDDDYASKCACTPKLQRKPSPVDTALPMSPINN